MYFWRTYTKVKNGKHPSIASSLKKKEEFKNHTQKVWLTPCCAHLLTEKKKKTVIIRHFLPKMAIVVLFARTFEQLFL